MKKHEKILKIIEEWENAVLETMKACRVKANCEGSVYHAGMTDALCSSLENLTERLEKAGFIGSKGPCGQVKK